MLQQKLDFSKAQSSAILVTTPTIMSLSLEKNLFPKLDFLINDVGLNKDRLQAYILKVCSWRFILDFICTITEV